MAEIKRAKEAEKLMIEADYLHLLSSEPDYVKALEKYNEVLELLPNDDDTFICDRKVMTKADVYNSRGFCYITLDQEEEALEDYNKAISMDPKNGDYYERRALLYLRLGEMEKAKADIEKAVELNPNEAGLYYCIFGNNIKNFTGNKREAAVYTKKSIELFEKLGKQDDRDYGFAKELLAKLGM